MHFVSKSGSVISSKSPSLSFRWSSIYYTDPDTCTHRHTRGLEHLPFFFLQRKCLFFWGVFLYKWIYIYIFIYIYIYMCVCVCFCLRTAFPVKQIKKIKISGRVRKRDCRVPMPFWPKSNMITNVILILYSSLIKKNLILTHLRFRHNIECFCSISPTNIISICVSEQKLFCDWMNQSFKCFSSVAMTHLLIVTCCHLLAVLISHLQ